MYYGTTRGIDRSIGLMDDECGVSVGESARAKTVRFHLRGSREVDGARSGCFRCREGRGCQTGGKSVIRLRPNPFASRRGRSTERSTPVWRRTRYEVQRWRTQLLTVIPSDRLV
jgi:hypothetical protein